MFIVILDFLFLFLQSTFILHLLHLLLPASFLNLPIEFRLHFPSLSFELLLLSVVELLGEQAAIVAALLQLLHFLFIKHQIIISDNKLAATEEFMGSLGMEGSGIIVFWWFVIGEAVIRWVIILIQIKSMDFGGSQRSVSPRQMVRRADNISQVSAYSNTGVQLKPIELLCHIHTDQPCNNYCIQGKCFQPLCAECIEGHLMLHKKNGYSDLSVKSLRGVRRDCVGRLGALIDELIRRLEQLEAPPSAERIAEVLQARLEQAQKEAHQIIELEFTRLRDSLRSRINQSSNILKGMADIHGKLEELIEQMKENCSTLVQGQRGSVSIPDCIRSTLTLNEQALLDMFEKESVAYEARRRKIEFEVSFNPQLFRSALTEALKIGTPNKQPAVSEASFSRPKMRNNLEESSEWDNSINATLPVQAQPQEGNRLLHFFETGSSRLHLVDVEGRKKIDSKVVTISQFIVPSFHASLVSQNGQFIYLSGGLVELNGRSKSPLFMRYNIRSQVTKKDFAKVTPRSSHSLCQDKNGDIFILGGYGQSQQHDEQSVYLTTVERVSERTGKVEIQPDSRWGGSNIAFRCKDLIVKACEEGIQLYSPKQRQWTTVDIRTKSQDFNFYKSAGFACLSESEVLIFGGYQHNLQPADNCFYWRLSLEGNRPTMHIKELGCRLPVAEGFDNGKAVVDQRGCFALQNIQDDEESCVDNERRLLRFDLKQGEGEWREVQIISN